MNRVLPAILVFVFVVLPAFAADDGPKSATPVEQYQALLKEFHDAAHGLYKATTDEEREKVAARVDKLPARLLELAEKNSGDPLALDALVQVVNQEIWLENNTSHPGHGKDSPQRRAIAILLRDHIRSPKLGEACRRIGYGFGKECEMFVRKALEQNPHKEVQAVACLRLAQFLVARQYRLDLLKDRPEMANRYEALFGKDYLAALNRHDRAQATKEIESIFERAADQYGDVKLPFGGTIGERAKSELHEIRHLSVGREAQDIEGQDQDAKRFKLSDYRGKVVLLYFWSEY
jgi:hypothetical protein